MFQNTKHIFYGLLFLFISKKRVFAGDINQDHLSVFMGAKDANEPLITRHEQKSVCNVVFPATSNRMDWMLNFQSNKKTLDIICPEESPQIHNYHPLLLHLTEGYIQKWNELQFDPEILISQCQGLDTLRFGGFSMGGSIASIAAVQTSYLISKCHSLPSLVSKNLELVTFGSPRVFDKETIEFILEARAEFDLIKKTRYCLYDDWSCHFYNHDSNQDYVHWGTAVTDLQDGEGHTHSTIWNWPEYSHTQGEQFIETSKRFAEFGVSFFPSYLKKELMNVNMDLSKLKKGTLRHLEYASLFDGIEECPYSAENCSQKEREDPQCMQYYKSSTILKVCESTF